MVTPQILDYIAAMRQQGKPDLKIMQDLTAGGWKYRDIQEAFDQSAGIIMEGAPSPEKIHQTVRFSAWFAVITVTVLVFLGAVFIVKRVLNIVNPAETLQTVGRQKKQADLVSMNTSLSLYYMKYERYPDSLNEILSQSDSLVKDPEILSKFDYAQTNDGQNYRLCVTSSGGDQTCITKDDGSAIFGPEPSEPPTEE